MWGTTGTSQALAPAGADPTAVAAVRVVFGGLALGLSAAARSMFRRLPVVAVGVATASLVTAQLAFFAAVDMTGVALGTVISIGSAPIAAGAAGRLFLGEELGRRWMVATFFGVCGCTLLLLGGQSVDVNPIGVFLALVVGCGYAGYTLATKDLVVEYPPDAVIAAVFGLAAVCLFPLLFVVNLDWTLQARGLLIAAHLALVTVAAAYALFSRGLRKVPAAAAVTLTLAEPLTAAVLGIAVLHEPVSLAVGVGMALVLAGLAMVARPDTD
jgi:DME family drug/metabolite transporter